MRRIYNPNILILVLTKDVNSLYDKQFLEESKPKRRLRNVKDIPAGSAKVVLRFDDDGRVDYDSFPDFADLKVFLSPNG